MTESDLRHEERGRFESLIYRWIFISTVNLVPFGFLIIVLIKKRTCRGVGVLNYLTKTTVLLPLLLPLLSRDNGTLINQLALMQLPWAYFETPGDQESVLGQKGRETIALCACQLWLSEGSRPLGGGICQTGGIPSANRNLRMAISEGKLGTLRASPAYSLFKPRKSVDGIEADNTNKYRAR